MLSGRLPVKFALTLTWFSTPPVKCNKKLHWTRNAIECFYSLYWLVIGPFMPMLLQQHLKAELLWYITFKLTYHTLHHQSTPKTWYIVLQLAALLRICPVQCGISHLKTSKVIFYTQTPTAGTKHRRQMNNQFSSRKCSETECFPINSTGFLYADYMAIKN